MEHHSGGNCEAISRNGSDGSGMFLYLLGTIQCAILSLFVERNLSAWTLKLNMELLLIGLTAIFRGLVRCLVHSWGMNMKGPFCPSHLGLFLQPFLVSAYLQIVFIMEV